MKQLVLPSEYSGEDLFTLSLEDSHYLLRVQRREIGSEIKLLDNSGNQYKGIIISLEEDLCTLSLTLERTSNQQEKPGIILLQAIPKGKKIDLIIRQAVEIGVKKIIPIMADHSVPQFKTESDRQKKRDRWIKIVKEASQQSGTKVITELENLYTMENALKTLPEEVCGIFFHQDPLKNRSLHEILSDCNQDIILVVGPEGGLSKREVTLLQDRAFTPVLLGNNILRAETATTFGLGAVSIIMYEQNSWDIAD